MLGNTYHLMLRPGAERVARLGGLHKFMNWPHPILTDSGGFQVMSLASLRKLTEQGVTFRSHIDGAHVTLTPERSIEIQGLLDSDIQMQLDECVALPASRDEVARAMERSLAEVRDAMRNRLAELLHLPLDRVSVKATTTEGMGFTGRQEGLLAQAIVAVDVPA